MGIIAWIILGLIAGLIATKLLPGRDRPGMGTTAALGVAAALVGGFLAAAIFDVEGTGGFLDAATWITAIAGATALLLAHHLSTARRSGGRPTRR